VDADRVADLPTEDPRPGDLRRAASLVVLNTGDGKGKSSAAFGVMLRSLARGWNVAVVQFVKSGKWQVGEETLGRRLGVDWFAVGDGFTWDSADLAHDQALARAGWEQAAELIEVADTVTEMRSVKHAYERGIRALRGIDY
jgi:ATP:corrinoid adenosyltransferase